MNDLIFKVGSTGLFVQAIQTHLKLDSDGKLGPVTLRAMQAKLGTKQASFTRAEVGAIGVRIGLGIDLSGWNEGGNNGLVDFSKVKTAGVDFVYLKLTQSTDYENREAIRQAAECRDRGILHGGYHFGDPSAKRPLNLVDLEADARAEAEHYIEFRRTTFQGAPVMRDALDLERMYAHKIKAIVWAALGVTSAKRAELCALWCLSWLDHVERATGRRPIIYTATWAWNAYVRAAPKALVDRLLSYDQWVASYNSGAGPKRTIKGAKVLIWQQSGSGKVAGVDGKVDINFALMEGLA